MDFELSDEHEAVQPTVRDWVNKEAPEGVRARARA